MVYSAQNTLVCNLHLTTHTFNSLPVQQSWWWNTTERLANCDYDLRRKQGQSPLWFLFPGLAMQYEVTCDYTLLLAQVYLGQVTACVPIITELWIPKKNTCDNNQTLIPLHNCMVSIYQFCTVSLDKIKFTSLMVDLNVLNSIPALALFPALLWL